MSTDARCLARCALLAAALTVIALPGVALAQAGSAGGSIGNDEQSLSGTRKARTVEPSDSGESRSRPRETHRTAPRGDGGGGGGSVDGAWAVVSVGQGCGTGSEAVVITSGRIIGQFTNGHVSPSGAATGAGASNGVSWTSTGRFAGRRGSGTFRRSDGCTGSWTATKQ